MLLTKETYKEEQTIHQLANNPMAIRLVRNSQIYGHNASVYQ